ncbi:heavy-metal-associated domain-containing protein [Sphingomonas sp.]|uniref:heavy-metal-associated domain-containing protein n=1 Tax=Sphingomonas sp. TaxID=28214 RepID=UPI00307DED88
MKRFAIIAGGALVIATAAIPLGASVAQASSSTATASRTATFTVENMTCALCPITVKKAMEGVKGVKSVRIDFDAKTATVVFDPAKATLTAIAAASTNAGYPASLKG